MTRPGGVRTTNLSQSKPGRLRTTAGVVPFATWRTSVNNKPGHSSPVLLALHSMPPERGHLPRPDDDDDAPPATLPFAGTRAAANRVASFAFRTFSGNNAHPGDSGSNAFTSIFT